MSSTMTPGADAGRHIHDDDLVRILDGVSSTSAAWSDHLSGCVECRTRVNTLSSVATSLRVAYNDTHIPDSVDEMPPSLRGRARAAASVRSSWATGRFARRAAAILLLAAGGTATAATIGHFARKADTSPSEDLPPAAVATPLNLRVDTASIAFGVSSGVITLDFASVPGMLRARLGNSDTLRLFVTSTNSLHATPAAPSLIALPDGIRIANTLTSGAIYDVILPAAAEELRVRLAGREVSVLHRPGMSSDRNVTVPVPSRISQ